MVPDAQTRAALTSSAPGAKVCIMKLLLQVTFIYELTGFNDLPLVSPREIGLTTGTFLKDNEADWDKGLFGAQCPKQVLGILSSETQFHG